MDSGGPAGSESRRLGPFAGIGSLGGRAAAAALRPLTDTMGVAVRIGSRVERAAVDRVLNSGELERIPTIAVSDPRVQAAIRGALASDGLSGLVDSFFDSRLFDHFVERLVASDGLWRLVDQIAQSPSVRAALSQQGLGFADQIGGAMRYRSRSADHRVQRTGWRSHRKPNGVPTDPDAPTP